MTLLTLTPATPGRGVEDMRCRICKSPVPVAATGRPPMYCPGGACKQKAYRKRKRGHPLGVHASSRSCEWATPQWLFDRLHAAHQFTLDVCATPQNAKCDRYFTEAEDGLGQTWRGNVWCNPPYGRRIAKWMRKARESAET